MSVKFCNLERTASLVFEKYVVETLLNRSKTSNFWLSVPFSGEKLWSMLPNDVKQKDYYLEQCQTQDSCKKIRGFFHHIVPCGTDWTVKGLKGQNAFDDYDKAKGEHNIVILEEKLAIIEKELAEELALFPVVK